MSLLSLLPRLGRQQVRVAASYLDIEPEQLLEELQREAYEAVRDQLETDRQPRRPSERQVNEIIRQVNLPEFENVLAASRARLREAWSSYDDKRREETWPPIKRAQAEIRLLEALEELSDG